MKYQIYTCTNLFINLLHVHTGYKEDIEDKLETLEAKQLILDNTLEAKSAVPREVTEMQDAVEGKNIKQ